MRFKHPDFLLGTMMPILKTMIMSNQLNCKSMPVFKAYKTGDSPEKWSTDIVSLIATQEDIDKKLLGVRVLKNLPWLKSGSRAYCPYFKWEVADSGIITFTVLPR